MIWDVIPTNRWFAYGKCVRRGITRDANGVYAPSDRVERFLSIRLPCKTTQYCVNTDEVTRGWAHLIIRFSSGMIVEQGSPGSLSSKVETGGGFLRDRAGLNDVWNFKVTRL